MGTIKVSDLKVGDKAMVGGVFGLPFPVTSIVECGDGRLSIQLENKGVSVSASKRFTMIVRPTDTVAVP